MVLMQECLNFKGSLTKLGKAVIGGFLVGLRF